MRDTLTFEEFDEHFIQSPDGLFPVYSGLEEDDDGEYLKVMQVDMICEWRMSEFSITNLLTDDKVKFIAVPFETKEQFDKIMEYLKVAADLLNQAILERLSKIPDEYESIKSL